METILAFFAGFVYAPDMLNHLGTIVKMSKTTEEHYRLWHMNR